MAIAAERWQELHTAIDGLPDDERAVVDLVWFHGVSQTEAAKLLRVELRTVQRRWQRARLRLYEVLYDRGPGQSSTLRGQPL